VGGAVIQDVRFNAMPQDNGWLIEDLAARLPGQATLAADGRLSTGEQVGFGGRVRLAVGQPATFAAWWRGKSEVGAGRLLSPFDLSGRAAITTGRIAVEEMTTRIGDATITGSFSWAAANAGQPLRSIRTDLDADRLDFVQIRALAELLVGHDFSDTSALADSYEIKLAAEELAIEDLLVRDVSIDAGFANGGLTVTGVEVGDIGGARFVVTRGQIDNILTQPLGRLEAQLTAPTLTGLARIIDRVAPDSGLSRWLRTVAPSLAPALVAITIDSVMDGDRPNTRVDLKGSAKATNFDASLELAGAPARWREAGVLVTASLKSYDALGVARQIGIAEDDASIDGGVQLRLTAEGTPATGLKSSLSGAFAGIELKAEGDFFAPPDLPMKFTGRYSISSADLGPFTRLVGLNIPGTGEDFPVSVAGKVESLGPSADLEWTNARVAGRIVSGRMRVARGDDGELRLEDGSLAVDLLDLGWLAALGLGESPLPTGNPDQPWPTTPFGEPVSGRLRAEIAIAADQLVVSDALSVRNAKARFTANGDRLNFDIKSGDALGGSVFGGFSIRNVGGNASLVGNVSLLGASLDAVVWRRNGRAVATGTLDLTANVEATGRSPAGMISSLTGGGTFNVHAGEVRNLHPEAAILVIRDSDRGEEFTEDSLRELLATYLDRRALTFTEIEAPFSIAAGTIRFQNVAIEADGAKASGSGVIDLNTMALDADWKLTLDIGADKYSSGLPPQIGLVFRGPLAEPSRIIDVLEFSSFLNIRKEARLQEILEFEQEARLENEWFNRVRRKLREDAERAARLAEALRAARIAAYANLGAFHLEREAAEEEKAERELIAWWAVAEKAADEKDAAEAAAREAAERAAAARALADEAAAKKNEIQTAALSAGDRVTEATAALARATETLEAAEAEATAAAAAREQAAQDLAQAEAAVEAADLALAEATATRESAATGLDEAAAGWRAATQSATEAAATASNLKAAAGAAAARAHELARSVDQLAAQFDAANVEVAAAEATLAANEEASRQASGKAAEAAARLAAARDALDQAKGAATEAVAALATAERAFADAEAALASARMAQGLAVAAVDAARGSETDIAAAAEADLARKRAELATAEAAFDRARAELDEARARVAANDAAEAQASRELAAAEARASEIASASDMAAAAIREARSVLEAKTAMRDRLAAELDDLTDSAEKAAAAAEAAAEKAETAADLARSALEAADTALRQRVAAEEILAAASQSEAAAQAALDRAKAEEEQAAAKLAEAESRLGAAKTALAAAQEAESLARAADQEALIAARQIMTDLAAADEAAASAAQEAEAAEAEAREAAARAAALPPGWRPEGPPPTRADAGGGTARKDLATAETHPAIEAPAVAAEPPAVDFVPVVPRPRPERANAAADPVTIDGDAGLPGDGRPLTISQPQ
jgi:hypothetical protein